MEPVSRREFLKKSGLGVLVIVTGCVPVNEIPATEPVKVLTNTLIPTPKPTPPISAEDVPLLNVIPSDGLYSERQIKQIADNEVLLEKVRSLSEDWVRWWASADQPEISLEALQAGKIKIVVRFDPRDPEIGTRALVILESEDHPGQIITQPWDTVKGELMEQFPETDPQGKSTDRTAGHPIIVGLKPFITDAAGDTLSDGTKADWIWENIEGRPARADGMTLKPLERINQNGEWEKAGREFIIPKTDVIEITEVAETAIDPLLVEVMKTVVIGVGSHYYLDRWGIGSGGEIVMIVKDDQYPEVELWGCPVYIPGIGSKLVLVSPEILRQAESLKMIRPLSDTGMIVDLSSAKDGEVKHYLTYLQGLKKLIDRRPISYPEFSNINQFENWMDTWMKNNQNVDHFSEEMHQVSVWISDFEGCSLLYKKKNLPGRLSLYYGKRLDIGKMGNHSVFLSGIQKRFDTNTASGVLRGEMGEMFCMDAPEGSGITPEKFSSNEALKNLMYEIAVLDNLHTFMAAVADEKTYLFAEAKYIVEPYGGFIKSEWLEEIKKYSGWPSTKVFDYTGNLTYEENNKLSNYTKGQGEMPVEFFEKVIDLKIEDSKLSYMNVKVGRFES